MTDYILKGYEGRDFSKDCESLDFPKMIKGLKGIRICKNVKGAIRRYFGFVIPNWIVENKEIDLVSIISAELRKQLDDYRKEFPIKNESQPQIILISTPIRITLDGTSAEMVNRDSTFITFAMDLRISNSEW